MHDDPATTMGQPGSRLATLTLEFGTGRTELVVPLDGKGLDGHFAGPAELVITWGRSRADRRVSLRYFPSPADLRARLTDLVRGALDDAAGRALCSALAHGHAVVTFDAAPSLVAMLPERLSRFRGLDDFLPHAGSPAVKDLYVFTHVAARPVPRRVA